MKCKMCNTEINDKKIKICPTCGAKVNRDKFPVWAVVLIVCTVLALPTLAIIGIVAAMTIPTLINNTNEAKFSAMYKKDLSTLNQALLMSEAVYGKTFTSSDDVWNKAIKDNLIIDKEIPDGIRLADLSEIKYEKLRDNCSVSPEDPKNISEKTACANLTIDVNGFDKEPNRASTVKSRTDRYLVLMYSNTVVPVPNSEEDKILHNDLYKSKRSN